MPPLSPAVSRLLGVVGLSAADADTPLALASLQVIQLVDAIELTHDLALDADLITRANFATPGAIEAMLRRLGADLD